MVATIIDMNARRAAHQPTRTRYMTCAETAKLVRIALAEAFPGSKFSVRSRTYSGGASIDVGWTDGPTSAEVEAISKRFEGADFDGMTDLKSYRPDVVLDGEPLDRWNCASTAGDKAQKLAYVTSKYTSPEPEGEQPIA